MSDTQRNSTEVMLREAGSLLHLIGGMGTSHLVLIGGLVPPLLLETEHEPHVGTSDIDFCLSVAITQGKTREYYHSIEEKITAYFEPSQDTSFRWRKKPGAPGMPILVDFLAPEDPSDGLQADGTRALDNQTAAKNAGPLLRPFTLKTGDILELDAEDREYEVDLLYKPTPTKAVVRLRHTGPIGFLVAKAFALDGRDDDKDGYDVAWFCINADPNPDAVAQLVAARPAFTHRLVPEALAILRKAFKEPTFVGPSGYANTLLGDEPGDAEAYEQARLDAHLATAQTIDALVARIDWDTLAT